MKMSFLKYKIKKLFRRKGKELLTECWWISIMLIFFPIVMLIFLISDMDDFKKDFKIMIGISIFSILFNLFLLYLTTISFWLLIPTLLITIATVSTVLIVNEASSMKLTIEEIRDIKLMKLMKK